MSLRSPALLLVLLASAGLPRCGDTNVPSPDVSFPGLVHRHLLDTRGDGLPDDLIVTDADASPGPDAADGSDARAPDLPDAPRDGPHADVPPDSPPDVPDADASLDADADVCIPQCEDMECGPDMCGGVCGVCSSSKPYCYFGQCEECEPACAGKECGADGCGGICGDCPPAFSCANGFCKAPACGEYKLILFEDFNTCTQGLFEVIDSQPDDNVTWWGVETQAASEPCSLYLGDPTTLTYETFAAVHVTLVSQPFGIPSAGAWRLTFRINVEAEPAPGPLYPYDYDVLFLTLVEETTGAVTPLFSTKELFNNTAGLFVPVAVDLLDVKGKTGRLVFDFNTIDSTDNDHLGVFLDDVRIDAICPYCDPEKSCDDQEACTSDSCVPFSNSPEVGTCIFTPGASDCCLGKDLSFCDDGNPCSLDACDQASALCTHTLDPTVPGCG